MGKKKLMIIVLAVLGIVSFAVSFLLVGKLAPAGKKAGPEKPLNAGLDRAGAGMIAADTEKPRPKEQQLDQLIKDLQVKMSELAQRESKLQEREKRFLMAEQTLKQDAQEMEKLRTDLVVPLRQLKEQIAELQLTRLTIERQERENLKKAAAMYAGMKDASAAKILEGMKEEEAVKILYYICVSDDRLAGKILSKVDPKVAIKLTDMLKRIQEQEK